MNRSKIRLYVAQSVDGYIATTDGSVDWLDQWNEVDYGFPAFIEEVGVLVYGRDTWDQTVASPESPHHGRPTHVLTSRPLDHPPEIATAWSDADALIDLLHEPLEKDVWVVGGAAAIRAFLDYGVIDRIDLFHIPVLLGDGIPLFEPSHRADKLTLIDSEVYGNGVIRATYRVG